MLGFAVAAGPRAVSAEETIYSAAVPLEKERRNKGVPPDRVELKLWLPEGMETVRGAVVNPFYLKAVTQEHWRAAARLWGFGIVSANYAGVSGQEFAPTLLAALRDFAEQSGRAEVAHLPFCFVGMSAGGGMSTRFAAELPERTIAVGPVALEVGPRSPESRRIPMITVFGERDGRQMEKLLARLPVERAEDAQWAVAVQWRRRHEFGQANNLLMPLFDHAIRHRYPESASPAAGPVKLRAYREEDGWLGDPATWDEPPARIAAFAEYEGDKGRACWFPDKYLARTWQSFVAKEPRLKIASPPGLGDGQPFLVHKPGEALTVAAAPAKELDIKRLELFDGDRSLGMKAAAPYEFAVEGLDAGIHALFVEAVTADGARTLSRPHTIVVAEE